MIWLGLNVVVAFAAVPWSLVQINKIHKFNVKRWYFIDMVLPFIVSSSTVMFALYLSGAVSSANEVNLVNSLLLSGVIYIVSFLLGLAASASLRYRIVQLLKTKCH